jgi:hypothetical protein
VVRSAIALVLAVALLGGHLAALQAVGWAGMLIERMPSRGVVAAVTSTFSGAEPCDVCTVVQDARDRDRAPSGVPTVCTVLPARPRPADTGASGLRPAPDLPPPRG